MPKEIVDNYLLSKEDATKIALHLVELKLVPKETVLIKSAQGFVPSGFESSGGVPRISWMESPILAEAVVDGLKEKPKPKEEFFIDRGGNKKKRK